MGKVPSHSLLYTFIRLIRLFTGMNSLFLLWFMFTCKDVNAAHWWRIVFLYPEGNETGVLGKNMFPLLLFAVLGLSEMYLCPSQRATTCQNALNQRSKAPYCLPRNLLSHVKFLKFANQFYNYSLERTFVFVQTVQIWLKAWDETLWPFSILI